MNKLVGLSLFANVGIAETYLEDLGVEIKVANEIDAIRANFYNHLYPKTTMIVGDIKEETIRERVVFESKKNKVDFVIATPPCQGMSLAGKMEQFDPRNQLIYYAVDVIKKLMPKYVLLENVPQLLKTKIIINDEILTIPEYIHKELDSNYYFADENIVCAKDFGVPQMRKRNIFLLSRKDMNYVWQVPPKRKVVTLKDAIYDLPSVDPLLREGLEETLKLFPNYLIKKEAAEKFSKFHRPPIHSKKHVIVMMYTPTGCTAFDNETFYPKKNDGTRVNGHYNTYRRFDWNKPARTITSNSGVISSLCCVHPGKPYKNNEEILYSEPRCLTLYELFVVFSLPPNRNVPHWANERFIRKVVGEGIPPLLVKTLVEKLVKNI